MASSSSSQDPTWECSRLFVQDHRLPTEVLPLLRRPGNQCLFGGRVGWWWWAQRAPRPGSGSRGRRSCGATDESRHRARLAARLGMADRGRQTCRRRTNPGMAEVEPRLAARDGGHARDSRDGGGRPTRRVWNSGRGRRSGPRLGAAARGAGAGAVDQGRRKRLRLDRVWGLGWHGVDSLGAAAGVGLSATRSTSQQAESFHPWGTNRVCRLQVLTRCSDVFDQRGQNITAEKPARCLDRAALAWPGDRIYMPLDCGPVRPRQP